MTIKKFNMDHSKENLTGIARFDHITPSIKGKVTRTDNGYLVGEAVVTRTGVFKYRNPDGSFRYELRHPDHVFNRDSLDSLKLVPMTNEHPKVKLLDARTAPKYSVGTVGETIRVDGGDVISSFAITDGKAVEDVDNGKKELSCGYTLDLVRQDGIYEGQKYTHIQTNVRYNHLALCKNGRAGTARLNLDNDDAVLDDTEPTEPPKRSKFAMKYNLDGIDYDADQQVINHITKLEKKLQSMEANLDSKQSEIDTLTAERDTLKTRTDELEKRDVKAEIAEAVKARRSLENKVSTHLDSETTKNLDIMSDTEIKKAVVSKAFPSLKEKVEEANETYLTACFDSAIEVLGKKDNKIPAQRQKISGNANNDANNDNDVDPEEEYRKRIFNSWKK